MDDCIIKHSLSMLTVCLTDNKTAGKDKSQPGSFEVINVVSFIVFGLLRESTFNLTCLLHCSRC